MSTSAVEVSGEKVKAISDKRLTEIFCDICIKEILKGNRPGTHFTKDGWLKIMTNFEKETGKAFSQRQLKIGGMPKKRMESLEELIRAKILGLGESLNQMFMGIVATGDKAWAPSSGTLRSDFFEDVNNEIPEENEEENKEILKANWRGCKIIQSNRKICNATDNMSQATSSLTLVMDPYGIPQAVKVLGSMSEEVPEASPLYFFSLKLLLNKEKRIMFLSINPKIRALWLKTKMEDS
ncbi:hypothetical protein GOBAR_AA15801 [Gossypium barbadense]|uniref:Myb/SANT-like domain-containing protein n=1 Tax=Gossypium barbadense TaxID=3634 RepID=A0A2P5XND5_GOSBA|nr:hypothetical protein GOBAR_AA15801 [Gossypium barbadense]